LKKGLIEAQGEHSVTLGISLNKDMRAESAIHIHSIAELGRLCEKCFFRQDLHDDRDKRKKK